MHIINYSLRTNFIILRRTEALKPLNQLKHSFLCPYGYNYRSPIFKPFNYNFKPSIPTYSIQYIVQAFNINVSSIAFKRKF